MKPTGWKESTIGEQTSWLSGGTPNRKVEEYWAGNIPWISASTMKTIELNTSDQFITEAAVSSGSKMAPLDSTLLLVRGSALHNEIRACLVRSPVAFNQDVKALIPSKEIEPKYLTYFILGSTYRLLKLVTSAGNTAGVLDTRIVQSFAFQVPPRDEQKAIAKALSDTDALIAALEKLITKKRAIKTATMQQLLTGKTRLPGFGEGKGYKDSELGRIPEDWEVLPLREISPNQSVGLVINPSTYFDDEGDVPILVGSNVYVNSIDAEGAKRITKKSNDSLPSSRLYEGDIVMVRVGDPGVVAVVPKELDGCNCASMMIVRRHSSFSSEWLSHQMNSEAGRQQVANVQYGTAQKQFNISDAVDFLYVTPPFDEQQAIAIVLTELDKSIAFINSRIDKTKAIKTAMMQQLLTGRTRLV